MQAQALLQILRDNSCRLMHLDDHIFLMLGTEEQAREAPKPTFNNAVFISIDLENGVPFVGAAEVGSPPSLSDIYRFSKVYYRKTIAIGCKQGNAESTDLFFCCPLRQQAIANAVVLIGGLLVLVRGHTSDSVASVFRPISPLFEQYDEGICVQDCWRALCHVRELGWLNFPEDLRNDLLDETSDHGSDATGAQEPIDSIRDQEQNHASSHLADGPAIDAAAKAAEPPYIDMEEYLHYADPNGRLHILAPGSLLVLPPPAVDLPAGTTWADLRDGRRFAPAFLAPLAADLGADLLVRAGPPGAYDPAAFLAAGVAIEDLAAGGGGGAGEAGAIAGMLRRMDRFLHLARVSPGAVAVHGALPGGGGGGGGGQGACGLCVLLSAALIRLHAFPAAAAVAWTVMAAPQSAAPADAAAAAAGAAGLPSSGGWVQGP